jgi:GntR family transcriptional regulator
VPGAEEVDEATAADRLGAQLDGLANRCFLRGPQPIEQLDRRLDPPPADTLSRQLPQRTVTPVGTSTKSARYRDIEAHLRGLIAAASPGDALPTEAELCARFDVSRMTVRQAVQQLSTAGLVDRQRGRGTFVAVRPMHRRPGVFLSFTEEMARRGMKASSRLVSARLDAARPEEIAELGLDEDASVVRVERVRFADGVPIAFEDAAVRGELRAVLGADLEHGSLHAELARLGTVAASATGTVAARLATRAEGRLLDVTARAALLVEVRLLLDQHGRPFERTESRYVADRYVIDVVHTS